MTIQIMTNKSIFQNPDGLAVENLKLTISNDGVVKNIPALDPYWVVRRPLPVFVAAPRGAAVVLGALQAWKEFMQSFIDDLKWLLSMEYHRFWSHIIHYPACMDMLVSFLQEASPPYLVPHADSAVRDLQEQAYRKILIIFTRLVTNKESQAEWMNMSYLGKTIYDHFIFTIPILCDICLLYGTTNKTLIAKLLNIVFQLQPKYYGDMTTAIIFLKQVFSFINLQIDNRSGPGTMPPTLPDAFKGFSQSFGGMQATPSRRPALTAAGLRDLVLHLLDCAVTTRSLMELHPAARKIFRQNDFHTSIVNLYENTIPQMYDKVVELNDSERDPSDEVFGQLDLIRAELVEAYRFIIATAIDDIVSESGEIESNVNIYLNIITDSMSEVAFIKDYHAAYPVDQDLDFLHKAYADLDPLKYSFILQAVLASTFDDDCPASGAAGSSSNMENYNGHVNYETPADSKIPSDSGTNADIPEEAKTSSFISEVKDILPHLGDGFILKCLEHYSFNSERVINTLLEGSLDPELQDIDPSLPLIPQDALDTQFLETGIDRLNVFDNDEFDVMTRDNIDSSRVHKGKRKSKHKNLSEMLNDKSHVREMKDMYTKFSLVSDEVDMYDDEYDDTYDGGAPDSVTEASADNVRKHLRPHALTPADVCLVESEDEAEDEASGTNGQPKDAFCVNPEEVRAKYQARRDMKYGSRTDRDVIGKAKGQDQDKDVLLSRQKKAAGKSTRGNHSRRTGAQWKRTQGMMPS